MVSAWRLGICTEYGSRVIGYVEDAIKALSAAREALHLAHSLHGLNPPRSSVAVVEELLESLRKAHTRLWIDLNRWPVVEKEEEVCDA